MGASNSPSADLAALSPQQIGPRAHRDTVGHAVKPVGNETSVAKRGCLANQDEKRGLERVFDVSGVSQHPPAEPKDHRAVQVDEGFKRRLVARAAGSDRATGRREAQSASRPATAGRSSPRSRFCSDAAKTVPPSLRRHPEYCTSAVRPIRDFPKSLRRSRARTS